MESHIDHSPKVTSPTVSCRSINSQLADGSVVSSTSSTDSPTHNHSSLHDSSKQSSPSPQQKRPMDNDCMESITKKQKFTHNNLIYPNIHTIKGYKSATTIFHKWCSDNNHNHKRLTSTLLIRFIHHLHQKKSISNKSILTYAYRLIATFPHHVQIRIKSSPSFTAVAKNLRANTLIVQKNWEYDVQPAIQFILDMGDNNKLSNYQFTMKTAWLLAMVGFLRLSDITRIDIDKSNIDDKNTLTLTIVGPKEKRFGYRITRSVTIHPHDNDLLCPVAAYKLYTSKFATAPCMVDVPSLAGVQVNALFRSQKIFGQAIGTQRVSKYIKQLMAKVGRQKGAPIPKARALGSTIAAASGISVDDIMAHGNWSSKVVFESFYRLSPQGSSNMTKATLDQQLRSQSSKCNLM